MKTDDKTLDEIMVKVRNSTIAIIKEYIIDEEEQMLVCILLLFWLTAVCIKVAEPTATKQELLELVNKEFDYHLTKLGK